MYTTGIIQSLQAFRYITYTDMNYNVHLYMAHSPCLCFPLLIPLCLPSYLLGTLLAVTGIVHLGLRLLVN
jgi:hypothetical protein